jgi:thiol-disulfide isomerase/thioredoxin
MKTPLFSLVTGAAAIAVCVAVTSKLPDAFAANMGASQPLKLPVERVMPNLDGAVTWLNSAPFTPAQLRGKVVLVDFWTYSCINCIRTVPYIRAWAEKYRDKGFVVLGVHTPEFQFEKDLTNVNAAMERFKIDFPVAVDSNHRIWQAFSNRFWPALYLSDANGRIRYHQFGEGGYDKMERAIQALLAEAGNSSGDTALATPSALDEQMAPDHLHLQSAETYVGYGQAENFRSPEGMQRNAVQSYSVGNLRLNEWGLVGGWTVHEDRATATQRGSGIVYRFSARDLHLVIGPGPGSKPVRIQVTVDGRAPGADHGADIDEQGNGIITQTRLYQLVRQTGKVSERRFEIRFLDPGAEAYAFTFG